MWISSGDGSSNMVNATDDEADTHGEDCTRVGVVETSGLLLVYFEIYFVCEILSNLNCTFRVCCN